MCATIKITSLASLSLDSTSADKSKYCRSDVINVLDMLAYVCVYFSVKLYAFSSVFSIVVFLVITIINASSSRTSFWSHTATTNFIRGYHHIFCSIAIFSHSVCQVRFVCLGRT